MRNEIEDLKMKERMFFFRAIESLQGKEVCLFEERIRMIMKKLQPAFVGKVNYLDESSFEEFNRETNRTIDQVSV